ncbi:MAG TPA: hypothetical protein VG078_05960 [Acidimicrobiales bacterium]|nr:hypothetical protein [Acidimicrobiales bacterium]
MLAEGGKVAGGAVGGGSVGGGSVGGGAAVVGGSGATVVGGSGVVIAVVAGGGVVVGTTAVAGITLAAGWSSVSVEDSSFSRPNAVSPARKRKNPRGAAAQRSQLTKRATRDSCGAPAANATSRLASVKTADSSDDRGGGGTAPSVPPSVSGTETSVGTSSSAIDGQP